MALSYRTSGSRSLAALLLVFSGCGGEAFESVGQGETGGTGGAGGAAATGGRSSSGGSPGTGGASASGGAPAGSGGAVSGSGGATGGGTELWARDYDQSCAIDSDCTLVTEGDACGCSGCDNAAIATRALNAWEHDQASIVCPPGNPGEVCAAGCAQMLPACASGTCASRPPLFVDALDFERTCTDASDCVLIFTGEVCSACRCAASAVNQAGYEAYLELVREVDCAPGPSPCDCASPSVVTCARPEPNAATGLCEVSF